MVPVEGKVRPDPVGGEQKHDFIVVLILAEYGVESRRDSVWHCRVSARQTNEPTRTSAMTDMFFSKQRHCPHTIILLRSKRCTLDDSKSWAADLSEIQEVFFFLSR